MWRHSERTSPAFFTSFKSRGEVESEWGLRGIIAHLLVCRRLAPGGRLSTANTASGPCAGQGEPSKVGAAGVLGPALALRFGENAVGVYLGLEFREEGRARGSCGFARIVARVQHVRANAAAEGGLFWGQHRQTAFHAPRFQMNWTRATRKAVSTSANVFCCL
jgi:hypothetical protein